LASLLYCCVLTPFNCLMSFERMMCPTATSHSILDGLAIEHSKKHSKSKRQDLTPLRRSNISLRVCISYLLPSFEQMPSKHQRKLLSLSPKKYNSREGQVYTFDKGSLFLIFSYLLSDSLVISLLKPLLVCITADSLIMKYLPISYRMHFLGYVA